ncbi:Exportin-4 [Nowakowskiella sp. JEL0407]|nr:Exportin-4 [Nowakowskiella sp. JEL0407]
MNVEKVVNELCNACIDANSVDPVRRDAALKFLNHAQNSPNIVPTLKYTIESTTNPSVQFHISRILAIAAVREYSIYSKEDIRSLRDGLISVVLRDENAENHSFKTVIRAAIVIAVRGWIDDSSDEREMFVNNVFTLCEGGSIKNTQIGLEIVSTILTEFSPRTSSMSGVPWAILFKCQKIFEESTLPTIFRFIFKIIHDVSATLKGSKERLSRELVWRLEKSISVVESILDWKFASLQENGLQMFSDDEDEFEGPKKILTRFPEHWGSLLSYESLGGFFEMMQENIPNSVKEKLMDCLIRFAALQGPIFANDESRIVYSQRLLQGSYILLQRFFSAPESIDITQLSQLLKTLIFNFQINVLISSSTVFTQTLQLIGTLTIETIRLLPNSVAAEASEYAEAQDLLLELWSVLITRTTTHMELRQATGHTVQENEKVLVSILRDAGDQIFATYLVKCIAVSQGDDEEEFAEADEELHHDRLINVAIIGRVNVLSALTKLCEELGARLQLFRNFFKPETVTQFDEKNWIAIFDQVHWLVLITGHVVADAYEGERPLVPSAINRNGSSADVAAVADKLVEVVQVIFGILEVFSIDAGNPLAERCSPLVTETLFWFIGRWSSTYLFLSLEENIKLTPKLLNTFGESGEGPKVLDFLLTTIQKNMILWNSNEDVLMEIVRVLMGFGKNVGVRITLLTSAHFEELFFSIVQTSAERPAVTHSPLVQAIASIISHATSDSRRVDYFMHFDEVIEKTLTKVVENPRFKQVYQNDQVKTDVMNALEMYIGLASASDPINSSLIFKSISKHFNTFIALLDIYHIFPEVVILTLSIFKAFFAHQSLEEMNPSEQQLTYVSTVRLLQTYARNELGQVVANMNLDEENEKLLNLIDLLSALSTAETSSFGYVEKDKIDQTSINVADILFYGVEIILPQLKDKFLEEEENCRIYFKFVCGLLQHFPKRLSTTSAATLQPLMMSIEFATNLLERGTGILAFQSISALALHVHHTPVYGATLGQYLDKFLRTILDQLLFQSFSNILLSSATETILILTVVRKQQYIQLIREIMQAQTIEIQQRMAVSFNQLTTFIEQLVFQYNLGFDRDAVSASRTSATTTQMQFDLIEQQKLTNRAGFRNALVVFETPFATFLADVRGYLQIKQTE